MKNEILPMLIFTFMIFLTGCAKKDLVIDMGKGDEIHLVGAADNFDCDDPAYAGVEKVHTWEMQFADGTSKYLCAPKDSVSKMNPEPSMPVPQPIAMPRIIQLGGESRVISPADVCMGAGCPHDN
jgi:hypothetical protein